jgi:hypothetical protein
MLVAAVLNKYCVLSSAWLLAGSCGQDHHSNHMEHVSLRVDFDNGYCEANAGGFNQKLILFKRGNAISAC